MDELAGMKGLRMARYMVAYEFIVLLFGLMLFLFIKWIHFVWFVTAGRGNSFNLGEENDFYGNKCQSFIKFYGFICKRD